MFLFFFFFFNFVLLLFYIALKSPFIYTAHLRIFTRVADTYGTYNYVV
uniref:Uncharacterized protein n=1 Tax=Rhizophora mucronata TaxID=61149 RepID=A0A2P2LZ61_RHIMU